jgi:hypothetical protein
MISKLLLAVQETIINSRNRETTGRLIQIYADIRQGLSFNKPPDVYGAFPTDPYSHTPKNQGAKQPGMTGLVKEEILTRQAELGFFIENGKLVFDFLLLDTTEFLTEPAPFLFWNLDGQPEKMDLQAGSLAYTICQVPVVLQVSSEESIKIYFTDGSTEHVDGHSLDSANSNHIFQRDGIIHHLTVSVYFKSSPADPG